MNIFEINKINDSIKTISDYCNNNDSCDGCLFAITDNKQKQYGGCKLKGKLPCDYADTLNDMEG